MCFLGGWWVARFTPGLWVRHEAALGTISAVLDLGFITVSGAAFEWLFVASNPGRIIAGTLGGLMAMRSDRPAPGPVAFGS